MNDTTFSDLKSLLKNIYFIYTIFKKKYRRTRIFGPYFVLWCIYKMQLYKLRLQRIPMEYHKILVEKALKSVNIVGDDRFYAIIGRNTYNVLGRKQWMRIEIDDVGLSGVNYALVQCLELDVEEGFLFVKEDTFFNACKIVGFADKECLPCVVYPVVENEIGDLASSVTVAPVLTHIEWVKDDEADVFSFYFRVPRCLSVGDIFTIPLDEFAVHLKKSAKYHLLNELHFKVLEIESSKKTGDSSGIFYAVQDQCDLFCSAPIPSFVPPKSEKFNSSLGVIYPNVPPDLKKSARTLSSYVKPFLKDQQLKIQPMFLLNGVSGSGKMTTLKAVSESLGLHLVIVDCYEFHNVGALAVEAKLEFLFVKAMKIGPCILAFTSLELLGKDKGNKEDARIVNCFLHHVSSLRHSETKFPLIAVGVSNEKTDMLLPSIFRTFIQTIKFQTPKSEEIVPTIAWIARDRGYEVEENSLEELSKKVTGYVHADLVLLVRHAIRIMCENFRKHLLLSDFEAGIELMDAAYSDAIGAAKVPSVRWDDIGGLTTLKEEVALTLSLPQRKPRLASGSLRRSGILFYGPPGTGKTLMAKAVATECGMNFLSVKGPELMNMYVGQSEKNVREVFERAREAAPCILFFDELDSLAPNRGKSGDGGGVTDRVVSQLLAEMDGLQTNRGLFVIAATNRPDLVDPALLRPGRFDKMFYLGPCADIDSKLSVLRALTKKFSLSKDVDLVTMAGNLPPCVTGADVYSVCSNAWLAAARRNIALIQKGAVVDFPLEVTVQDFERGIADLVPSLSEDDLNYYQKLSSSTSER